MTDPTSADAIAAVRRALTFILDLGANNLIGIQPKDPARLRLALSMLEEHEALTRVLEDEKAAQSLAPLSDDDARRLMEIRECAETRKSWGHSREAYDVFLLRLLDAAHAEIETLARSLSRRA